MEVAMNTSINSNNINGKFFDMESFTNKLKKEDDYNLRILKSNFWIYIGFIGLYSIILIAELILFDKGIFSILPQIFFILSFVAFILIFKYNIKFFKKIDYSLPLAEMLTAVAERYKFRYGHFSILLIPIILMDAGLTFSFYDDLGSMSPLNRVLIVQAFYIPIMAISALIGILIWRHKQKPLRDKALELLKELQS